MGCISSLSALGAVVTLASGGSEVLTIGTGPAFPPYLYQAADGTLSGMDHELAEGICARIKARCRWEVVEFEELIPGVREGRFDFVLGGMAVTPARRQLVDFTAPYTHGGGLDWYVGPPGAPAPEAARIAVISGTIQAHWVASEGLDARPFIDELATLEAVAAGKADLAFGAFDDRSDLAPAISGHGFDFLWSEQVPDDGVAIAVCKGNDALLDQLNTAIRAMDEDGTLVGLETRWQ